MLRNLVLNIGALLLGNIVAHLRSHRTAHFPVNLVVRRSTSWTAGNKIIKVKAGGKIVKLILRSRTRLRNIRCEMIQEENWRQKI